MRTSTTNVDTALNSLSGGGLVLLVEMLLDSGTVRLASTPVNVTWNGYTWTGLGNVGSVDGSRDSETGEVVGLKFRLSGVPSSTISLALGETYQGRTVNLYLGVCIAPSQTIVDGVLEYSATLDIMEVEEDMETGRCEVIISAETDLIEWQRPRVRFYNDADQQRDYPGDRGLEYAASLEQKVLTWPSAEFFKK